MKLLTFDIEDWFHILNLPLVESPEAWSNYEPRIHQGTERILKLLKRTNQTATFFVLGWIADKYPEVVKSIVEDGHEVGSHSYHHQLVYKQSAFEFEEDLIRSLEALRKVTKKDVTMYRAPGFSITRETPWAIEILMRNGIEIDCSLFGAVRSHGGIPNFDFNGPIQIEHNNQKLKALPMSIANVCGVSFCYSGGGYFRLLPSAIISQFVQRSEYVMTYFHPRDFDPEQPKLPMSRPRSFKSYVGIKGAMQKLEKLLYANQFTSIQSGIRNLDWNSTPTVIL